MSNSPRMVDRILHDCDLYKQTTGILAALVHILEGQHAATVDIGRQVRSYADDGSDCGFVTPDLMAQGPNLNMVGEVKATFSHKAHGKILAQLKKYDGRLGGWMIKDVPSHDLVVLTPIKNSVALSDYLNSKINDSGVIFRSPLSVAEFTRTDNDTVEFFLRIAWGRMTNPGLAASMRTGISVPAQEIVDRMSTFWFYDSEPPLAYTMAFLWEKIFPYKLDPNTFAASGRKKVKLEVTVHQILLGLDKISTNMPKPKDKWITKALDELVSMGMAKRHGDSSYTIRYYKLPGKQPLRTFAEKYARAHLDARLDPFLGGAPYEDKE